MKWHVETDNEGWQKLVDELGFQVTSEYAHISDVDLTPIADAHNELIDQTVHDCLAPSDLTDK